ncbi:putative membrane protein [Bacteroides fragilis str. I1345]|nr:putative membrane protein [Bacteroides fragilis str. 2-F-2 \
MMLIYNHFMIVSYFKTTDKIIYFFTFLFNLFWVSMPLASNVFIV